VGHELEQIGVAEGIEGFFEILDAWSSGARLSGQGSWRLALFARFFNNARNGASFPPVAMATNPFAENFCPELAEKIPHPSDRAHSSGKQRTHICRCLSFEEWRQVGSWPNAQEQRQIKTVHWLPSPLSASTYDLRWRDFSVKSDQRIQGQSHSSEHININSR
jgi:hypothetical protein